VQTGPEKNPRGPPRSPGLPLDINLHDKSSPESKSKAVSFRPNAEFDSRIRTWNCEPGRCERKPNPKLDLQTNRPRRPSLRQFRFNRMPSGTRTCEPGRCERKPNPKLDLQTNHPQRPSLRPFRFDRMPSLTGEFEPGLANQAAASENQIRNWTCRQGRKSTPRLP